jgi:hypothetical protein
VRPLRTDSLRAGINGDIEKIFYNIEA